MISGHTGFKGSWLSEWLCMLGANVVGYSLKPDPKLDPCYTTPSHFLELGLRDQIAAHVGDGRLVPVLEEYEPPALPVHILHVEGRMVSAKVRAFVDFAATRLRADQALQYQGAILMRERK